jgi:hypothetical protein
MTVEVLHEEEHMTPRRQTNLPLALREQLEKIPAGEFIGPDPDSAPPPLPAKLCEDLETILGAVKWPRALRSEGIARVLERLRGPVHVARTFRVDFVDQWAALFEPLALQSAKTYRLLAYAEKHAPGVLALAFADSPLHPALALQMLKELESAATAARKHLPPKPRPTTGPRPWRRPGGERDFRRAVAAVVRDCGLSPARNKPQGWFAKLLLALYPYAVGRPLGGVTRRLLSDTLD